jgi:hypothetical protein
MEPRSLRQLRGHRSFSEPSDHLHIRSEVFLQQTAPFPLRSARPSTLRLGIRDRRRLPSDDLPRGCGAGDGMASRRNRPHSLVRCGGRIGCRCLCHPQKHQISTARSKGRTGAHRNISESSGSCRDMATPMPEALRALGLPARFASGYLDCAPLTATSRRASSNSTSTPCG